MHAMEIIMTAIDFSISLQSNLSDYVLMPSVGNVININDYNHSQENFILCLDASYLLSQ